jgi:hypothetical protein
MMTWDELMDDDIIPRRKPEVMDKYQLFMKNNSLTDNIMTNVIKDKTKDLHLTFNDYPYDVENDVSHYIIWDIKKDQLERKEQLDRYREFAESNFNPDIYDIIVKINKIQYQSIPEIKHCHLFTRLKNKSL